MDYNVRICEYNGELQLSVYSSSIHRLDEVVKNEISKQSFKSNQCLPAFDEQSIALSVKNSQVRSRRRSKQTIYRICRANNWEWFATFTFKNLRYDYDCCKQRLQQFLKNFSYFKTHIEYLAVPEQHDDGAWHFHVLLQGNLKPFLTSGWRSGRYQFVDFKYGINEVERINDSNKAAMYITKYITKELQDVLKNKRRFLCSRGVKRGDEYFDNVDVSSLYDYIMNKYPDYDISYVNKCSFGDGTVHYIQLKERV